MKILIGCVATSLSILLSGCVTNREPEAKLPPHIAEKRKAEQFEWDKGMNDAMKDKGAFEGAGAAEDYEKKNGKRPSGP